MTNKRKNYLSSLTQEEREEILAKARVTMAEKKAWAKENLRSDFADHPLWRELAREYKIRLPQAHIPNTETKYLVRAVNKINKEWGSNYTITEYLQACGATTLKQLAAMNPSYPAYVEVGLLLEWVAEQSVDEKFVDETLQEEYRNEK